MTLRRGKQTRTCRLYGDGLKASEVPEEGLYRSRSSARPESIYCEVTMKITHIPDELIWPEVKKIIENIANDKTKAEIINKAFEEHNGSKKA